MWFFSSICLYGKTFVQKGKNQTLNPVESSTFEDNVFDFDKFTARATGLKYWSVTQQAAERQEIDQINILILLTFALKMLFFNSDMQRVVLYKCASFKYSELQPT